MAERSLKKRISQCNLKAAIVRPSIIFSCVNEPMVGWTDTLAASGGMMFGISSGLMQYVPCDPTMIVDLVPCDFVSNLVIVAAVMTARSPDPILNIVHSTSSDIHPTTLGTFRDAGLSYVNKHPYNKQVFEPYTSALGNPS